MAMKDLRENKKYGVQIAYVLDNINNEDETLKTDKEKIDYFFEHFNDEYECPYVRKKYPCEGERIADYVRNIPSCIDVAFENYDIIQIGKSWGYCKNKTQENNFLCNWWNTLAFRLVQIRDFYKNKNYEDEKL